MDWDVLCYCGDERDFGLDGGDDGGGGVRRGNEDGGGIGLQILHCLLAFVRRLSLDLDLAAYSTYSIHINFTGYI